MPRTDTSSRLIDAAPESIYRALIDPAALIHWLPPGTMTGAIDRFDARPGGSYRMVLTYPDASNSRGKSTPDADVVEARFIDLVPGVRVAYAVQFETADAAYDGTMTIAWDLTPVGGATRVDVTAENVPDAVPAEDHAAGMASSLEQLARFVAG